MNQSNIEKAIKKHFINPLNIGCKHNIGRIETEKRVKHDETVRLLRQAYNTLNNAFKLLYDLNINDANILLRSSFEYIMMADLIQFHEDIYDEFTKIGLESRDKTRIEKLISKFKTHLNTLSEPLFKDFNRKEKQEILEDFYDKLCNFTHSSIIVSTTVMVTSLKEKEVLKSLMLQNFYFVKVLLFYSLIYFTNDNDHFLQEENISYSVFLSFIFISNKIKNSNVDFNKYNEYIFYEKNFDKYEELKSKAEKQKKELLDLKNIPEEKKDKFVKGLIEFLK